MVPSRLNVTIAVISTSGLAFEAGGGCQQRCNRMKASLMLSTESDAAWLAGTHDNSSGTESSGTVSHGGDLRARAIRPHLISEATCTFTILSGSCTGSPRLILSTTSMPDTTSPTTVYLPFRNEPSPNMMKNCEFAESLLAERAMPTMPRLNGTLENSALRFGYFEPPVPLKFLPSPVCAMKPSITRWNGTLL